MERRFKVGLKACLIVSDFEDAESVTRAIGLPPSKVNHKGDIVRVDPKGIGPPIVRKENAWVHELGGFGDVCVESVLDSALSILEQYGAKILHVADKYSIELSIYGNSTIDTRLGMHIGPQQLRQLAVMGIELDLDVYPYTEGVLDAPEKIQSLAERISDIDDVLALSSDQHDEATAIATALATLESKMPMVLDSYIPGLMWDALDQTDIAQRLMQISSSMNAIQEVLGRSKYLVVKDQESSS